MDHSKINTLKGITLEISLIKNINKEQFTWNSRVPAMSF